MDNCNVTIPINRFEELLDKETRLDVLTERLINNAFLSTEDALRIIGSRIAVETANKLREEDYKKYREEYLGEQYSESDA